MSASFWLELRLAAPLDGLAAWHALSPGAGAVRGEEARPLLSALSSVAGRAISGGARLQFFPREAEAERQARAPAPVFPAGGGLGSGPGGPYRDLAGGPPSLVWLWVGGTARYSRYGTLSVAAAPPLTRATLRALVAALPLLLEEPTWFRWGGVRADALAPEVVAGLVPLAAG